MKINRNIDENDANIKRAQPLSLENCTTLCLSKYLPDKILSACKQGFSAPDASCSKVKVLTT